MTHRVLVLRENVEHGGQVSRGGGGRATRGFGDAYDGCGGYGVKFRCRSFCGREESCIQSQTFQFMELIRFVIRPVPDNPNRQPCKPLGPRKPINCVDICHRSNRQPLYQLGCEI